MRKAVTATLGISAALAAGVLATSVPSSGADTRSSSRPMPDSSGPSPAKFNHPASNPYFPLVPGTVSRLRGSDEGERFREVVRVTHDTKTILGIEATVVRDVVRRVDGTLAEKTEDWYAPDNTGNVWYLGEDTATYDEHGRIESREGSWEAGVAGAVAGMIMPADPRPTDAFRQEFFRRHAEDQAWVVQRGFSVEVPYGTVKGSLRTFEWTRLEPHVMSTKIYGPGLGIVRERDVSGGNEVFKLVSVRHP